MPLAQWAKPTHTDTCAFGRARVGVGGGKAEGAVPVLPDRRCMCTVWGYLAFCWAAMVVYMSPRQAVLTLVNMVAHLHNLEPHSPATCLRAPSKA